MTQIIDFQEAKMRLRPRVTRRSFLVMEIPEELAKEMESADVINVLAQIDFLVH